MCTDSNAEPPYASPNGLGVRYLRASEESISRDQFVYDARSMVIGVVSEDPLDVCSGTMLRELMSCNNDCFHAQKLYDVE